MKVTLDGIELKNALAKLKNSLAPKNHTMPQLRSVLVDVTDDATTLSTTDLEVAQTIEVEAEGVAVLGSTLVNFDKLDKIVKRKAKAKSGKVSVTIESETGKAVVKAGKTEYTLGALLADDYPVLPEVTNPATGSANAARLDEAIATVEHAMSNDETRYHLNGIFFEVKNEGTALVATDGHRLALCKLDPEDIGLSHDHERIVPRCAVKALHGLLKGQGSVHTLLSFGEEHARFEVDGHKVTVKYVDGEFPDYRRVVPDEFGAVHRAVFGAGDLVDAIGNVTLVHDTTGGHGVRLTMNGDMRVSSRTAEGNEAVETIGLVSHNNRDEEVVAGYCDAYLLDALKALRSEEVEIRMKDERSQAVFGRPDDDSVSLIIMPMRI